MNKETFLQRLRQEFSEYSGDEINKFIGYYSEMIDECVENGMSEEDAVASFGSIESIVEQIKCELPLTTLVKYTVKEKRKNAHSLPTWAVVWGVILLVVGAPLWFPLVITAIVLLCVGYFLIWVMDFLVWASMFSAMCGVVGGLVGTFVSLFHLAIGSALVYFGFGWILAGLSILLFFAGLMATKGICLGTGWFFRRLKRWIAGGRQGKEELVS